MKVLSLPRPQLIAWATIVVLQTLALVALGITGWRIVAVIILLRLTGMVLSELESWS